MKRRYIKPELNELPFYMGQMILLSGFIVVCFLFFIYQQWKVINDNEHLLTYYHLPTISSTYQLHSELVDLENKIPKDISSLYMAQIMSEYNIDMSSQTRFSYKRKIISDLLERIRLLQNNQEEKFFEPSLRRLESATIILLDTLKQNEKAFRIESTAINLDLKLVKIFTEQLRRLHERAEKHTAIVVSFNYQRLVFSASLLGFCLLLIWAAVVIGSLVIIRKAIKKQQSAEQKIVESQRLLEDILNHASTIIYLKDLDGQYIFVNRQFELLFNVKNKDFIGKTDYEIHAKDIAKKMRKNDRSVLKLLDNIEFEEIVKHGNKFHTYLSIKFPLFNQRSMVYGICGISTDITKRKENELNLRKLNLAVEQSPNLVVITNTKGIIEYANQKLTEITGYQLDEVIGQLPSIFKSENTPDSVHEELWETISQDNEWRGVFQNKKKNGEHYWVQESIASVKNEAGETTHYVAIQEDVTKARALSDKVSYQAEHDSLTGLINRQAFEVRLDRVLKTAKNNDSEHALCYLDLDQFKIVNDTCTHAAGDELLRQLSRELSNTIRHRDTLGRLGGDEFAVLMEHCSLDQAERTAEKILETVSKFQFGWENKSFRIGVSIGLIPISSFSGSLGDLLKQADIACYAAKDGGRNRIHIFHQNDNTYMQQHHGEMDWVSKINHALEYNHFVLYAQAITPLKPQLDQHYEILIRMIDVTGKVVSPGAFLPAVERYHLSQKIDRWVIHNTLLWMKNNTSNYKPNTIFSINLSGQNLGDELLLKFIFEEFNRSSVPYHNICFEITETAAIINLSSATEFIMSLKNVGCKFSIDDFGSGLSSFDYLKKLPVDFLKIDGAFVKDITDDPVDLALVKSINEIGHVMGKQTIAEFVENQEILDVLNEMGVDYAQGYYLDKPKLLSTLKIQK